MNRSTHPSISVPACWKNRMCGSPIVRMPLAAGLCLCLWIVLTGVLLAGPDSAPGTGRAAPAPGADRAAAFGKVLDGQFTAANLNQWHVPGAVFVAVQDGAVILARGYGFADLEGKKRVAADRTIFRAGSVSKPFTATAVMQLCERGRLDLDEDVNRYLRRIKLARNFSSPVTLRHLLTHTAGLAEFVHGQHPREESRWQPLAEYLARRMPPRIMPPGRIFSYNDHGYSLAGLVVQDVSGLSYEDYMEQSILRPLGMGRSTFRQRPPAPCRGDLAVGYKYKDGRYVPYSLDTCETVPAAGLYTSAADVARFMIAILEGGRLGEARILTEESAEKLCRRAFAHHPRLRGRSLGFSEMYADGRGVIFHDGGMPGFNTRLCLVPGKRCGFFMAWNSDTLSPKYELTKAYLDVFFPGADISPAAAEPALTGVDLQPFAGRYGEVDGLDLSCLKIGGVLENSLTVEATPAGTLRAMGSEFHPVAPRLFRDPDGYPIAFRPGRGQGMEYVFVGTAAFRKMPFWEAPGFLLALCVLFFLVFLPMGFVWSGSGWFLRKKLGPFWRRTFPAGSRLAGLVSVLTVLFLAGFLGLFLQMDHYWQIMRNEFPWSWMTRLLFLPLLIGGLALALPVYSVLAWIRRDGTWFGRCCLSLVTVTAALFVWTLVAWNMVGFNY